MELVDFLFFDFFPLILDLTDRVFDFLGKSVSELVSDWIGLDLPNWDIFDTPLLLFMIGSGLTVFVAFTLIKWIIGIIT